MHRHGAYTFLVNDEDKEMLKWLQVFKYSLLIKYFTHCTETLNK